MRVSDKSHRCRGGALVELALTLPLLLLLILNVVNFGSFLYACVTVSNAARAGADFLMMGPASIGYRSLPTNAQVQAVVAADLGSLPNAASATITICTTANGSGSPQPPGTCVTAVTDPQNTSATLGHVVVGQVNVTYPYTPLISAFNFTGLGVRLTLPATSITRHAAVRLLQ